MRYKLTSQREESVTIDGLGVLPPATWEGSAESEDLVLTPSLSEFDERAVDAFYLQRGLHVNQVTLPEGVVATLVIEEVN
jgi:hypothetical protein